jgi:large subunit ribosomal protein L24
MKRVKRNDTVRVISGKDAGKEGRVIRVYPKNEKVMVEGINVATRHDPLQRSRRGGSQEGGISHVEMPLHVSNVMPICPSCDTPARVGTRLVDDKRTRYCRRCDAEF